MTPSERAHLSDQLRRLRAAEQRDPVNNALFAFLALDDRGRADMAARFNEVQKDRPTSLTYRAAGK